MRTRQGTAALRSTVGLIALLGLLAAAPSARAQLSFDVQVNTSGLINTDSLLAFDLTGGDLATGNNTVTISLFSTDGSLAGATNTQTNGASGDLPGDVTLTDSSFFNESSRGLKLGTTLAFHLSSTNNFAGGAPDEFAFFILNSAGTAGLFSTTDPAGADALFILDLDGTPSGGLQVFQSATGIVTYSVVPTAVPEPGTLAMIGGIFIPFSLRQLRRRS